MKEQVLAFLEARKGEYVSGREIGDRLGLTRAAVWKSIKALKEDGYAISAGTNRGYCLAADSDVLTEAGIRKYLSTKTLGNRLELYRTIDSTNTRVKAAAQSHAPEGLCVIAEEQTAGRGRFGRQFLSPQGGGVYLSVLLRPELTIEQSALITAAASVCTAQAIESLTGSTVQIKWVNDLFVRGKKACGILTEAGIELESRKTDYVIVGIGVNLSDAKIAPELGKIAGGIVPAGVTPPSRCRLAAEILNRLEEMLDGFSAEKFLPEYRRRSNVIGHRVTILRNGAECGAGTAVDIDEQARLVVKLDDGRIEHLSSGEVSCKAAD